VSFDGPDPVPTADAQHTAGHAGQLEVGILQRLLDAVGHLHLLAHQLHALSRQVAQVAHGTVGHAAGLEQAALQQLRDPLRVLDVGLAAGHLLDVLGVDQQLHRHGSESA
jgi:hypothetical protein